MTDGVCGWEHHHVSNPSERTHVEVCRNVGAVSGPGDWHSLRVGSEAGLLNTLTKEEILDLLAYLESLGDSTHPNFKK